MGVCQNGMASSVLLGGVSQDLLRYLQHGQGVVGIGSICENGSKLHSWD